MPNISCRYAVLKCHPATADHSAVRSVSLVFTLVSLAVAAYLVAAQWSANGPAKPNAASKAERDAYVVAASFAAQRAESELTAYRYRTGTYAGAAVTDVEGVRLVRADSSSFCLQIAVSGATLYDKGPGGEVGATPC
jgi:hypothetical protein